jgi:ArsR family transcriptional regulator, lead/cadmium/zinc/bismuth-responsive transcriptional repressor
MSICSDDLISPDDICEIQNVDRDRISSLQKKMEDQAMLGEIAELFNALGDPTRVRILHALSLEELCVCEISELIGLSSSAISHQLRLLRMNRLVKNRKSGKMVYYSLDDDHVRTLLEQSLKHVREDRR